MTRKRLANTAARGRKSAHAASRVVIENTIAPAGSSRAGDLFAGVDRSHVMLGEFLIEITDGDPGTREIVARMLAGTPTRKPAPPPPPPPPPPVDPDREELFAEICAAVGWDPVASEFIRTGDSGTPGMGSP